MYLFSRYIIHFLRLVTRAVKAVAWIYYQFITQHFKRLYEYIACSLNIYNSLELLKNLLPVVSTQILIKILKSKCITYTTKYSD